MIMHQRYLVGISAVLVIAICTAARAQPSFDCAKVKAECTEAMICGDAELSAMDREVDRLYRKIKSQTSGEDFRSIQAFQRGWIKGRNESWKATDPRQFIFDSYQERIAMLSIQAGEVTVPEPVTYKCAGGEFEQLTAVYYDTKPPVGVFTRVPGGDFPQYITTGWPDDGAIHYNIGGLDFVERDGIAELNWAGTLMKCTRLTAQ
jgi:uncharacterized protein